MMMEGLGYNPIVPDFVMDMAWRKAVPALEPWSAGVGRPPLRRPQRACAGCVADCSSQTAYRSAPQTGTFLAERPGFYREGDARTAPSRCAVRRPACSPRRSTRCSRRSAELGRNDAYRYDVVNLTRQVLGQLGLPMVNAVEAAFARKDRAALLAAAEAARDQAAARSRRAGRNARGVPARPLAGGRRSGGARRARSGISTSGTRGTSSPSGARKCTEGQNDDLNLYAYKEWQGMFSGYYLPRWQEFFARLDASLDSGTPFDRAPFAADMCRLGAAVVEGHDAFATAPRGDAVETAVRMYGRYRAEFTR